MNTHEFSIWLNGWVELNDSKIPTQSQWKMIVEHLNLCFNKVTKPLEKEDRVKPIDFNNDETIKELIKKINDKPTITPYTVPPFILPNPYNGKGFPDSTVICSTNNGPGVDMTTQKLCNSKNDLTFTPDNIIVGDVHYCNDSKSPDLTFTPENIIIKNNSKGFIC
jgi:hypothetical protein